MKGLKMVFWISLLKSLLRRSSGDLYLLSPVSLRLFFAILDSSAGAYVSGSTKATRSVQSPAKAKSAQKSSLQSAPLAAIKPDIMGATDGPAKGAKAKTDRAKTF